MMRKREIKSEEGLSVSDIYSILVADLGINPEYVLDRMEMYEVNALIKNQYRRHKDDWEQARLIAYLIAQCNSKKRMKLTDIVKFPWEKKNVKDEIDFEAIKRIRAKAHSMLENNVIK